ncbi:type IV pilus assembly protein PilM [Legionella oakridgensis ATCC 33761 = DSM 21215]|uniref:Type IV pilus assembly protein PilM n=3 Tax=Legionella oakridgensis TaxID=29423 RepID=W0B833_9GAMM|nr:type IV pilus assembly protein PilM [Legionella oakridgensis ATCC 33761 = DSM 21215]ETO93578.1 type IV pilus assembly protein PilM [Legionella oakridgensis RV-2-2007]KTD38084.1 Tfp pilus assembly protein, ATPase PilM [Legionella oakridgensis]STY19843.1 type IV pilus assembly protein PilM [Legionella longbeachae]
MLGVDISATSVKILEISISGERHCVEGYGRAVLPETAMEGNIIKDVDAVADCIRKILSSEHLTCKQAALAVPDSATISKIIQINDGLKDEEMEEIVVMEADKLIPYPIDEINLDFNVLGSSSKNTAMLDVLLVASRAENVSNRVEAITRAGLEAKVVDVESYAVERAAQLLMSDLPAEGVNKIIAIIDIGAVYTHFFALHGLKIIFTREEEFGGRQLLESIMQRYGMKAEEAAVALQQGTLPEDYEKDVLQPFRELVLLRVKRGLQFFFSASDHTYVDHILLAGGVAKQLNIAQLLQEHINIPASVANPLKHMDFANGVSRERVMSDSSRLLVACGLALRA